MQRLITSPLSLLVLPLAFACSSCTSLNAIKRGDLSGVITAPFELAGNVLDTTSVLEGKDPEWLKQMPKTYTDRTNQAKVTMPRAFGYTSVSWDGAKDDKGYATGRGTLQSWGTGGKYDSAETGTMHRGRFQGTTKEIDKEGKEWKIAWNDDLTYSRSRVYSQKEIQEQKAKELAKTRELDSRTAERRDAYKKEKEYLYSFRSKVREGTYVKAAPEGSSNSLSLALFGGGLYYGRVVAAFGSETIRVRRDDYRLGESVPETFTSSKRRVFPPEWSSAKARYHIGD